MQVMTFATGYPSTGAIWSINPTAVIALGLVKAPAATARYDIYLVDIGLPLVSDTSYDQVIVLTDLAQGGN